MHNSGGSRPWLAALARASPRTFGVAKLALPTTLATGVYVVRTGSATLRLTVG